jgi:ribosomal-protein-alanine N-acetyltransferase
MRVRPYTPDDLPAIYAIQLQCPQSAQWHEEDYRELAREPGGMILVAEIEVANLPALAGFAAFFQVLDETELRNIAIDPAQQRRGIGRALLAAGIHALWELGVHQVYLEVRASNQPALAFYSAAGFRPLYTRRDYYHDPAEDALVMARDIAS